MRVRMTDNTKSSYFTKSNESLDFISSGSTLLDLVLGGGYPLRRVTNIVGDASTGKTLLCIEAMINFLRKYPKGIVDYQEVESAFDANYAEELGLDTSKIRILEDVEMINDTQKATNHFLKLIEKKGEPGLRIIDTLDAIHDRETTDLAEGYDAARRAAHVNSLVTKSVGMFKRANANLIIVSQIRDNIGVMFGAKHRRAGGKAMDFYTSQVLWLYEVKKISRTIDKIKRDTAIKIRAKCKKNKIGLPYRDCEFSIVFGYGIDDVTSCVEWLNSIECLDELSDSKSIKEIIQRLHAKEKGLRAKMVNLVNEKWRDIETKFLPKHKKYD